MACGGQDLESLQDRIGYRWLHLELLVAALTHRSYANERGLPVHYERLEFLGDAVLGALTAEWLYRRHPELLEGRLSKLKSFLVSEPVLASFAETLGLGEELRLGVGEERSGGRAKVSLLADAFEAVIGALFLDGGLEAARELVVAFLEEEIEVRGEGGSGDAKTRLQETAQARGWELPDYRQVAAEGPDHRKVFTVECWLHGERAGTGTGPTKKIAQQRAAAAALAELAGA